MTTLGRAYDTEKVENYIDGVNGPIKSILLGRDEKDVKDEIRNWGGDMTNDNETLVNSIYNKARKQSGIDQQVFQSSEKN